LNVRDAIEAEDRANTVVTAAASARSADGYTSDAPTRSIGSLRLQLDESKSDHRTVADALDVLRAGRVDRANPYASEAPVDSSQHEYRPIALVEPHAYASTAPVWSSHVGLSSSMASERVDVEEHAISALLSRYRYANPATSSFEASVDEQAVVQQGVLPARAQPTQVTTAGTDSVTRTPEPSGDNAAAVSVNSMAPTEMPDAKVQRVSRRGGAFRCTGPTKQVG